MSEASSCIDLPELLGKRLGLRHEDCEGMAVVVTGAGRGIGLQTARSFAWLGARVALAEISLDLGQAAEDSIRGEGGDAFFFPCDVSSADSVARLQSAVGERYGAAQVLVNNAIRCPVSPVLEMEPAEWDSVIAVNLRGTYLMTRAFLPEMLAHGSGVIVNMVSTDAMPGLSAYIASKQGISGFSQSLAQEIAGQGVAVIPFAPGMVDTPAIRGVAGRLAPLLGVTEEGFLHMSLHPAYEGLMPPEHAGAATVYLALRLAEEFNGQPVNGYEVLERAGLLHSPEIAAPLPVPTEAAQPVASSFAELAEPLHRLERALEETGQEFERLPIFVRPMARGGFKNKSGQSLEDWKRSVESLSQRPTSPSPAEAASWRARLERLADYFRDVPKETARFTRDADLLAQVTALSQERIEIIRQIVAGLG
jgi:NAD(P)-dependent dehydrogenase (short-subunit alcohol dehydrogenase family)